MLREFGGDVQAANQTFLLFEDVERIAGGGAAFERHAAGEGVGVEEALDEVERAAVIPMQFVAPVARFFFEQRLNLTDRSLAQIDDVHGGKDSCAAPAARIHHKGGAGSKGRKGVRKATQRKMPARGAEQKVCYDANHHISIVRQKKAAAAASPV